MPSVKLTREIIRDLQPRETAYEVHDEDCTGLLLRVHPTGRMVWIVSFARGRKLTIGRADTLTPSEARRKARAVIAGWEKGIDPHAARREMKRKQQRPTLRSYIEGEYGTWAHAHYKDAETTLERMKVNFVDLLDKPLDEITAWDVERWRAARKKAGLSAASANRYLTPFKALLKRAAEWGVIPADPLTGAIKPQKVDSRAKVRYLSQDEEKRLRAALRARDTRIRKQRASANEWRRKRGYDLLPTITPGFADHLEPLVILSINTGLRRGEAFALTWGDIDIAGRLLTVQGKDAKSGTTRHVPLNDEAHAVLKTWRRQIRGTGHVFPGENGGRLTSVRSSWEKVLEDAKITDFRWHDLRHTFASRLVMAGVDLNTVRELLGHADIKMTLRYSHLAPHVKADAVARLVSSR